MVTYCCNDQHTKIETTRFSVSGCSSVISVFYMPEASLLETGDMFRLGEFVEDSQAGSEDQVKVLHFLGPRKREICIRCGEAIYSAEKGLFLLKTAFTSAQVCKMLVSPTQIVCECDFWKNFNWMMLLVKSVQGVATKTLNRHLSARESPKTKKVGLQLSSAANNLFHIQNEQDQFNSHASGDFSVDCSLYANLKCKILSLCERISADIGVALHKNCFRCATCNVTLTHGSYILASHQHDDGKVRCMHAPGSRAQRTSCVGRWCSWPWQIDLLTHAEPVVTVDICGFCGFMVR